MADYLGKVVEILDRNGLRRAWVAKQVGEKLQVRSEHGRQERGHVKGVVLVYPQVIDQRSWEQSAPEYSQRVEQCGSQVELELLWQGVVEEPREYGVDELAALLFGEAEVEHRSALWCALLEDSVFFKRKSRSFEPRDEQWVAELLEAQRRRLYREQLEAKLRAWIAELKAPQQMAAMGNGALLPQEFEKPIEQLYAYLYQGQQGEWCSLLAKDDNGEFDRWQAYRILASCGRIAPNVDPFMALAGLEIRFPERVWESALALVPQLAEGEEREDFSSALCFSVDDAETQEIDDAFSLSIQDSENYQLAIHIADASAFCQPGDVLDLEAHSRGTSMYLPKGTVTMFPPALSHQLASLVAQQRRPAVSLILQIRGGSEILSARFTRTWIHVDHRLTYEQVQDFLAEERTSNDGLSDALKLMHHLAQSRQQQRRAAGALMMDRMDLQIRVEQERVNIRRIDPSRESQVLVSESMILYNELVARHLAKNSVPCIYRAQPSPKESLGELPTVYDPISAEKIFKKLKPSRLSTKPGHHFGLALDFYTQATSPLRRYGDLVIQRQLVSQLMSKTPSYSVEALKQLQGPIEQRGRKRNKLERDAKRYWCLEFLRQVPAETPLMGTVVGYVESKKSRTHALVELERYFVRGELELGSEKLKVGSQLELEIVEVNPQTRQLRLVVQG